MLRISKLADYGTVLMVFLARHSQGLFNAKEIASRSHVAGPTVSKLLKLLANAELVVSQRGTKGGYQLSRPAHAISVAQIIKAVEGHQGLTECSHQLGDCAIENVCGIRGNWQLISHVIHDALEKMTLEQLASPKLNKHEISIGQIRNGVHP